MLFIKEIITIFVFLRYYTNIFKILKSKRGGPKIFGSPL